MASRQILVVDDNVSSAETLALLIGLSGHITRIAHSGPDALEVARSSCPDVVLLDIGLPGMDGYEVARRLRQDEANKRVLLVAVTGYGQDDDRRRSSDAGFDHHLVKPLDIERSKASSPMSTPRHPAEALPIEAAAKPLIAQRQVVCHAQAGCGVIQRGALASCRVIAGSSSKVSAIASRPLRRRCRWASGTSKAKSAARPCRGGSST